MLTINGKRLDDPAHVFVIAEASGNHNQDYATAEALVHAAAEAGADAIKFQSIDTNALAVDVPILTGFDPRHDAWISSLGVTRLPQLFAKAGLPRDWHAPLKALAESLGLSFLSTPFSLDAAHFLVEDVGVSALKIASGDLTYEPLLHYAASTGLPTILSTGASTLAEVQQACAWFESASPHDAGWQRLLLLHCVSTYPAPNSIMNLRAIQTLETHLVCAGVGLSDHTLNIDVVPALAVAMGACVYEKHLRLAQDTTSVDAQHSLSSGQFRHLVEVLRETPIILGTGEKVPHASEMHDRLHARRDPSDWRRPQMRGREGAWQ